MLAFPFFQNNDLSNYLQQLWWATSKKTGEVPRFLLPLTVTGINAGMVLTRLHRRSSSLQNLRRERIFSEWQEISYFLMIKVFRWVRWFRNTKIGMPESSPMTRKDMFVWETALTFKSFVSRTFISVNNRHCDKRLVPIPTCSARKRIKRNSFRSLSHTNHLFNPSSSFSWKIQVGWRIAAWSAPSTKDLSVFHSPNDEDEQWKKRVYISPFLCRISLSSINLAAYFSTSAKGKHLYFYTAESSGSTTFWSKGSSKHNWFKNLFTLLIRYNV